MGYERHPVFEEPTDQHKLWRFISFTKYVAMLDQRALYFARARYLGDRFEGSNTRMNIEAFEEILRSTFPDMPEDERHARVSQERDNMAKVNEGMTLFHLINCWHESDHESAAMWKLYASEDAGIAVQTTMRRLREALHTDETVYIGRVHYIDYDATPIPADNLFWPFLHKRQSFSHEREVRAIIARIPIIDDMDERQARDSVIDWTDPGDTGINIAVDLDSLLESVRVSPSAPGWFVNVTLSVTERYGVDIAVERSTLGVDPLF